MKTLYISDLDGTLLGSNGLPSRFTADTINSLVEKGLNFTFATARSVSSASKILETLKPKLPAVMMNGVFITDIETKEQRYVCKMEKSLAQRVIDAFIKNGHPPIVYTLNDGFIDAQYKEAKSEFEENFIAERVKLYHSFLKTDIYNVEEGAVYVNCIDEKSVTDKICAELEKIEGVKFSHYLDVYSKDKYFVEVYSSEAGKKNTVQKLKEMYGFEKVVAFGDNLNDYEMLKSADVAVAVGNAKEELKQIADEIIDTNDNDGVAKYLLKIFNQKT